MKRRKAGAAALLVVAFVLFAGTCVFASSVLDYNRAIALDVAHISSGSTSGEERPDFWRARRAVAIAKTMACGLAFIACAAGAVSLLRRRT